MKKNLFLILIPFIIISLCSFYGCNGNNSTTSQILEEHNHEFNKEGKVILYKDTPYYGFVDEDEQLTDNNPPTKEGNKKVEKLMQNYRTAKDNNDFVIQNYLNGVSIVKYQGKEDTVEIPETLDGKAVLKIGGYYHNYDSSSNVIYFFKPAFDCSKIKKLILPKTIKEIVHNSFHTVCYSEEDSSEDILEIIEVSPENQYYCSSDGILYSKDKSVLLCVPSNNSMSEINIDSNTYSAYEIISSNTVRLNIPNGLKEISAKDYDAISEKKVISKSTTEVFENGLNTALREITVKNGNDYFSSIDGVLYNKNGSELIIYPYDKQEREFQIPNKVKKVDDFCINNIKNLETLIFGQEIEKINCYVFYSPDAEWNVPLPTLNVIKGYTDSVAEKWAKENKIGFISIK